MPNPYALTEMPAANDSANPYALRSIEADGRTALRSSLLSAQASNPDQAAEAVKLARTTGAPYQAIEQNLPEVRNDARLDEYEKMLAGSPATRQFLTTPQNAAIAHDDVGNLSAIEGAFRQAQAQGRAVRGQVGEPFSRPGDQRTSGGRVGETFIRRGNIVEIKPTVAGGIFNLERLRAADAGFSVKAADALGLDAGPAIKRFRDAKRRAEVLNPEIENDTLRAIYGGLQSTVDLAAAIGLSLFTRSPVPALSVLGAQTFGESYGKYRERGGTAGQAGLGATLEAGTEIATEALPMGFLVQRLGKVGAGQFITGLLAREIPGEQIATVVQDAVDTAIANPDKTWGQYLAERPAAAYQTLVATMTQTGVMASANVLARKIAGPQAQAEQAEQHAQAVEQRAKVIEASKLKARDLDAFRAFIEDVAAGGDGPAELFIDAQQLANTLNQSAITLEELRAIAPSVAAQLEAAQHVPGADIRVPVAEFAAAPSEITTALLDHLREAPDAMSRAEAQAFMKDQGGRIQKDVETALADTASRTELQASIDKVRQHFEDQLNAAGKSRPEVNRAYATALGNYYAVQAQRSGMSVEDFMERYRLKVMKGEGALGSRQRFEQNGPVATEKDVAGTNQGGRSAGDSTGAPGLITEPMDYAPGMSVPVHVRADESVSGMRFEVASNGQATLRVSPVFMRDKQFVYARTFRAIDSFLWPYGEDVYVRAHHKKADFEYLKKGSHRGSRNHFTGEEEGGLSVARGVEAGLDYAALVTGKQIGQGSDSEPLLDVSSVKLVSDVMPSHKLRDQIAADTQKKLLALGITEQQRRALKVAHNLDFDPPNEPPASAGSDAILNQGPDPAPRASLSFAEDITSAPSMIALLENADLSSLLHEGGHFFLEVQSDLAQRIQAQIAGGASVSEGERQIVADMGAILEWMGIKGDAQTTPLQAWARMPLEEKREHHEKWARGFERFLMEGKAPSQELQSLFSKFRSWLISVYKTLKNLNVDLSDEVRQVMGRMLATDEAIAEAQAARDMGPLYQSPEQSGMTPAEYAEYQGLAARQTAQATAELDARLMKDMKWLSKARAKALKEAQAEADDLRREVEIEVRAEVLAAPVYQAWQFLTGKRPKAQDQTASEEAQKDIADWKVKRAEQEEAYKRQERERLYAANPDVKGLQKGQLAAKNKRQIDITVAQRMLDWDQANPQPARVAPVLEDLGPDFDVGKINTDAAKAANKKAASTLIERRMTSPSGLDPEIVASKFGFTSGDHLMQAVADAPPPSQVIDEMVDRVMLERHGDISSDEALARAADEAVHNEVRARVVAAELRAVEKANSVRAGKRNTIDVLARAAKDYAYAAIASLRVRDIRPGQYSAAQARSAKLARQALGKSTEDVALHKRNELINTQAARAAYDALAEVKAMQAYFRKLEKRPASIDPDYLDQIDALLERFEFRTVSNKALDKRARLADWLAKLEEDGIEPEIPPEMVDEANHKNFREMTVEELRGLHATVQQIEHLGRLKNKLLTAKDKREFDAIRAEIVDSIAMHAGDKRADNRTRPTALDASIRMFNGYVLQHRKVASLALELDGFQDGGPVWEYLIRPMNEAGDREATMRAKAAADLAALFKPLRAGGKMGGGGIFFDGVATSTDREAGHTGSSFNREERLSIALNTGNEGNMQRLLDGEGWTAGQVQKILDTLTVTDWKFVQSVWNYFESYRPEIAAQERRLYGREPDWVVPTPRTVVAGGEAVQLRGGYLPVKYDVARSARAESLSEAQVAKQLQGKAMFTSKTRDSFVKARSKEVKGRPLLYSTDAIFNGVNEVIHRLAWQEWVVDANHLMKDKAIDETIRTRYGAQVVAQFKSAINDIAAGEFPATSNFEGGLARLRAGAVISGLGLNLVNAVVNVTGITQTMVRIGVKWYGVGLAKYAASPIDLSREVWAKSEMMANRARTMQREVNEIQSYVRDKSQARAVMDRTMFLPLTATQVLVDMPSWWGAYQKALDGGNEESRAIALADQAVIDAQSGGQIKDLAAIQRGVPLLKLWTMFYGYFSASYNLSVEKTKATDFRDPLQVLQLGGTYLMLWTIPALLGTLLKNLLIGDDWDEERLAKKAASDQVSYLLGFLIGLRETAAAVQLALGVSEFNMGYGGPAGARFFAELQKLGQQIGQGEADMAAFKALSNVLGIAFKLPSGQVNRTVGGIDALLDDKTDNPLAVIAGPPSKK